MTFRLIFGIVLAIVGLGMLPFGTKAVDQDLQVPLRKIGLITLGVSGVFLLLACIRIVAPGEVGIPVAFGNAGAPIGSGVHFVNPFADVRKLSVRTEEYTMSIAGNEGDKQGDDSVAVLGSDGATGHVDATLVYRLETTAASKMFREVGTNFVAKIVRPTSRSCIRDAFVNYTMVDSATKKRSSVATDVEACVEGVFAARGLVLEDLQLRDIGLSETVQNAINAKVEAEQRSLQQRFELERSQQQSEISRVEAQGRADAQQIIACGGHVVVADDGTSTVVPNSGTTCQNTLTPAYLQYLYIQTLQATVDSDNHSTIILPFDQKLTPLLNLPAGGN
jgi:prohibitin 1